MTDRAVPNLPSRDFDATVEFYGGFGFEPTYRDEGWLILRRGGIELEFFPFADVVPEESSFLCSIRVDDVDELYASVRASGVPEADVGMPRLHAVRMQPFGLRVGYLVDLDGTQLNLVENARDS